MSLTEQERIERRRVYERNYNKRPGIRQKDYARCAVNVALARGELIRALSCEVCGETVDLEAHHEDYSKPLVVKWLCVRCHRAVHHKTHCKRGHALTPDNIQVRAKSGRGSCKACSQDRVREYRKRVPYAERGHSCGDLAERIAPWLGTRR